MPLTAKFILIDWAEWTGTSIPGPLAMVYTFSSMARVIWGFLLAAVYGIFFYQVFLIVERLLLKQAIIQVTLGVMQRSFPILTVCNQNPYKLDIVRSNPNFSSIATLMDDYSRMVAAGYGPIENDTYGLNNVSTRYTKELWVRTSLVLLASELPVVVRQEAVYSFGELFAYCYYNGVPCYEDNFTSYLDATYGACYQFNAPPHSGFQVYRAGSRFGLEVLLTVKQVDPSTGIPIYLPTTQLAGVRIRATYQKNDTAMESFGLDIPVGFEIQAAMKLVTTSLLKQPYGKCVDTETRPQLNYYSIPNNSTGSEGGTNHSYTLQVCLRSCKQNGAIAACGCADPRYNKPVNISYCNVTEVGCILDLLGHNEKITKRSSRSTQRDDQSFSPVRDCDCHPPCQQWDVTLSTTQRSFPSEGFTPPPPPVPPLAAPSSPPSPNSGPLCSLNGSVGECRRWLAKNALLLNVWFDSLDYEANNQVVEYTILEASNELGGQMLLWCGISVINIVEFGALLAMFAYFFAYGRNVRVVPSAEEFSADPRYRNIQGLRAELDRHEAHTNELRGKIEQQRAERRARRRPLQQQIGQQTRVVEEGRQRAHIAKELLRQQPGNLAAKAALANAQSLVAGHQRILDELRREYESTY